MNLSAHFTEEEFQCKCCGQQHLISTDLLNELELLRTHFDAAVLIISGYRCAAHNKEVGGAPNSQHMQGIAADIKVFHDGVQVSPRVVADYLENKFSDSHGIGRYPTWTHFDVRGNKSRWGSNGI